MGIFRGIQGRIMMVLFSFVLLMGVTIGGTFMVAKMQSSDAVVIDIAGRQCFLTVGILAKAQELILALESESSIKEAQDMLRSRVALFDRSLSALRDGGATRDSQENEVVLPRSDPATVTQLRGLSEIWMAYRANLEVILAPEVDVTSEAFFNVSDEILDQHQALMAGAFETVPLLKMDSARKGDLMRRVQIGAAVLTLAVCLVTWIFARRQLVLPVRKTLEMIRNLERGELSTRLKMNSGDEIGEMASAMDRFADSLQVEVIGSLARLAAGDLRIRVTPRGNDDQLRGALKKLGEDLRGLIGNVQVVGEQLASGSGQVAGSLNSVLLGVGKVSELIGEIASATQKQARGGASPDGTFLIGLFVTRRSEPRSRSDKSPGDVGAHCQRGALDSAF